MKTISDTRLDEIRINGLWAKEGEIEILANNEHRHRHPAPCVWIWDEVRGAWQSGCNIHAVEKGAFCSNCGHPIEAKTKVDEPVAFTIEGQSATAGECAAFIQGVDIATPAKPAVKPWIKLTYVNEISVRDAIEQLQRAIDELRKERAV